MGFENVGKVWTPESLGAYLATLTPPDWCRAVTLHHTASPSLAMRPNGLTAQHIRNIEYGYKHKDPPWTSGPHLFADDDQLWGMCDFRRKGVHAVGFNRTAIGIEVLGDYSTRGAGEDPKTGRGLQCWKTAAAGTKVLLRWLDLEVNNENTVVFHREDGHTSKDCPGNLVTKNWILGLIRDASEEPVDTTYPKPALDVTLNDSEWQFTGEQWCVPVRVYLGKKGVSVEVIRQQLQKRGAHFYYGDEWLEGAYYHKDSEATWAPVRELLELV